MKGNQFKYILFLFILLVFCSSCVSVARLSVFENNNRIIKFDSLAQINFSDGGAWNWKGCNEYFFESKNIDTGKILLSIMETLDIQGYRIISRNLKEGAIIGKRGLTPNEWNSIVGIYFLTQKTTRVYVRVKITQDITGGWKENRAKNIGFTLQQIINSN